MAPFPNRLTYRGQPGRILKLIRCSFQILYDAGCQYEHFVSCNGRPRNIIAALGYLTGLHKKYSHFHTFCRTELSQGVLESQKPVVCINLLNCVRNIYQGSFLFERSSMLPTFIRKSYNFYYNFLIKTDRQLPGFFLGLAPPLVIVLNLLKPANGKCGNFLLLL